MNDKFDLTELTEDDRLLLGNRGIDERKIDTMSRIRAIKDFSSVKKGDIGGFVDRSSEVIPYDDYSWLYDDSVLMDGARIAEKSEIFGDSIIRGSTISRSHLNNTNVEQSTIDYCTVSHSNLFRADVDFSTIRVSTFNNASGTDLKMKESSVNHVVEKMMGGQYDHAHIEYADDIRPYSITNSLIKGDREDGLPSIVASSVEDSKVYGKSDIKENSSAYNSLIVNGALYESFALDATIKGAAGFSSVVNTTVEDNVTVDTMSVYDDRTFDYKGISPERDAELTALDEEYGVAYYAKREENKPPKVMFKEDDLINFAGDDVVTLTDDDLIDLEESDTLQL